MSPPDGIERPLLLVPGIGATFGAGPFAKEWFTTRGIEPTRPDPDPPEGEEPEELGTIEIDPLAGTYYDLIESLENVGYAVDESLFLVNYDWRVAVGPDPDGSFDGEVALGDPDDFVTEDIRYAVDYFGYHLKRAAEAWAAEYGEAPESVDVISHSTGGLVTRAYVQSTVYGETTSDELTLPTVHDFAMVGVPNRGASKAWNPLHNDFGCDPSYQFVVSKIGFQAFTMLAEEYVDEIEGPGDENITRDDVIEDGEPDFETFISMYVPTVRDLLGTYPFLVDGDDDEPRHINDDDDLDHLRNDAALNLNAGVDVDAFLEAGDVFAPDGELVDESTDPNAFVDRLSGDGRALVIVSADEETVTHAVERTGFFELSLPPIAGMHQYLGRYPMPTETWYEDAYGPDGAGDGTVPLTSAAGQFDPDARFDEDGPGELHGMVPEEATDTLLGDLERADLHTTGGDDANITHSGMVQDPVVQRILLERLVGAENVDEADISTGLGYMSWGSKTGMVADIATLAITAFSRGLYDHLAYVGEGTDLIDEQLDAAEKFLEETLGIALVRHHGDRTSRPGIGIAMADNLEDVDTTDFGDGWSFTRHVSADLSLELLIQPDPDTLVSVDLQVHGTDDGLAEAEASAEIGYDAADHPDGDEFVLLGSPDASRLALQSFGAYGDASVSGALDYGGLPLYDDEGTAIGSGDVTLGMPISARLVLGTDGYDNFLSSVLPADGIDQEFDVRVGWSVTEGFHLGTSKTPELSLPFDTTIGPLNLQELFLSGEPDRPAPELLKEAAAEAVAALDIDQIDDLDELAQVAGNVIDVRQLDDFDGLLEDVLEGLEVDDLGSLVAFAVDELPAGELDDLLDGALDGIALQNLDALSDPRTLLELAGDELDVGDLADLDALVDEAVELLDAVEFVEGASLEEVTWLFDLAGDLDGIEDVDDLLGTVGDVVDEAHVTDSDDPDELLAIAGLAVDLDDVSNRQALVQTVADEVDGVDPSTLDAEVATLGELYAIADGAIAAEDVDHVESLLADAIGDLTVVDLEALDAQNLAGDFDGIEDPVGIEDVDALTALETLLDLAGDALPIDGVTDLEGLIDEATAVIGAAGVGDTAGIEDAADLGDLLGLVEAAGGTIDLDLAGNLDDLLETALAESVDEFGDLEALVEAAGDAIDVSDFDELLDLAVDAIDIRDLDDLAALAGDVIDPGDIENVESLLETAADSIDVDNPDWATLKNVEGAVSVDLDSRTVYLTGAASGSVELGPATASVRRLGIDATLSVPESGTPWPPTADLSLKPPDGVGIAVDSGPVSGGGYLELDHENSRYAGALQLHVGDLTLNAVGLLTTELPDGGDGFSLLVIIAGEFTPVQLGFGFTLNGVGGLVGIHRSMKKKPLQEAVRSGSLDSVLFPQDPVANAQRIVSDLRTIFPPTRGTHVFGPMVRLGWGTPTLITADLGVVLEVPSMNIAILGRLGAVLPDEIAPIIELNMDVLGFIDQDGQEVSIDATLFDSRVLQWSLSGDFALRSGWGQNPRFILSAGGFHPEYDPPGDFPELDRVKASMGKPDGRLSVEYSGYFAVTTNTVQVGGAVDASASAGSLEASGRIWFDALFEFDPFYFKINFGVKFSVTYKGKGFSLTAKGQLEGPSPWYVEGRVEIDLKLKTVGKSFSGSIGSDSDDAGLPPADVMSKLLEELERPGNWSAQRPAEAGSLVTVREIDAMTAPDAGPDAEGEAAERVLVHPLGTISVRQTVVPLDFRIEVFGNARPAKETKFTIEGAAAEGEASALDLEGTLEEDFAPGQYLDLTEEEKLDSPSFESLPAGRTVESSGVFRGADSAEDRRENAREATLCYDTIVEDRRKDNVLTPLSDLGRFKSQPVEAAYLTEPVRLAQAFDDVGAVATAGSRTVGKAKYTTTATTDASTTAAGSAVASRVDVDADSDTLTVTAEPVADADGADEGGDETLAESTATRATVADASVATATSGPTLSVDEGKYVPVYAADLTPAPFAEGPVSKSAAKRAIARHVRANPAETGRYQVVERRRVRTATEGVR